jgi:murein DD-endopeptidase MepM/ murein hydrolase activator NlpD
VRSVLAFLIGVALGAVALYAYLLSVGRVMPAAVSLSAVEAAVPASTKKPKEDQPKPLGLPIEGLTAKDLRDTFDEGRAGHTHEAIDIMKPRGTPVHAVTDGTIAKLFLSKPGGKTIYQFDDAGKYCYYYAHLDRYAEGMKEGMRVKRGDLIAYVGSTGDADPNAPHLHFSIFELGPEKHWWQGTAVNPYPVLKQLVTE